MRSTILEGDYLIYNNLDLYPEFNQKNSEPIQVLKIDPFNWDTPLTVRKVKSEETFNCSYGHINLFIVTSELLKKMGFAEIPGGQGSTFVFESIRLFSIAIHSIVILDGQQKFFIGTTGFCYVPTAEDRFDLEHYKTDGLFNMDRFGSDFPCLSNLNDLLTKYKAINIAFDIEQFLSL